jgi:hypothetical protein
MIEAILQSDSVLMVGAVVGLAGTTLLIARDTANRALVERPTLIVVDATSDLDRAA